MKTTTFDDRAFNRRLIPPVCVRCKRYKIGTEACDAFPKQIPDPIWNGENDHTGAYPGDQGIRFAKGPRRRPERRRGADRGVMVGHARSGGHDSP